jgi:hypothetical protein
MACGKVQIYAMLKHKLVTSAYLTVIFISISGMLKMIFDAPPIQSTSTTTVAHPATSPPSVLPISRTLGPEPTPEPTQSTRIATVHPTPTPKPLKSRVVKHQPNQFRKGALSKEELSAIKKAIRTIQWSRNSDPKAAADEDYAAIVKECEKSSVPDLLADLITEAASNDYQPGNEAANSTYITELVSDFETRVNLDVAVHVSSGVLWAGLFAVKKPVFLSAIAEHGENLSYRFQRASSGWPAKAPDAPGRVLRSG